VLVAGEDWQLVAEGFKFSEGPAVDRQGNVFFTDIPANRIHRADAAGKVSVFAEDTAAANGLMFGPDGRLYACRAGERKIVAYDTAAKPHTVAEDIDSNDLVVTSSGGMYVTDPPKKQVWYIDPRGNKRVVASGLAPNGIILWPDEGTLVVTDSDKPHLWTYRVEADGSLKYGERYYQPLMMPAGRDRPGSDGMTVDREGRLYVCTHAGLQMFDPTGRLGGVIRKPQEKFLSNVVFGGEKLDYLYVTCTDKVFRRKVKPIGAPYFQRASDQKGSRE
jgi:sugar lactone lactonase YvrE